MERLEQLFERILWQSRLVVLVGVVASALVSLSAFCLATVDVVYLLRDSFSYASLRLPGEQRAALRSEVASGIVKAVDGYLLLALVIEFFQQALKLKYGSALDLVYLALGILAIEGALLCTCLTRTIELYGISPISISTLPAFV